MKKYILAIDQGTTSSRAILFNKNYEVAGIEQEETTQIFPEQGWVEQNAGEIWENQLFVIRKLISRLGISLNEIASIGITNQRESIVIWDKKTGKPVYNAIIWQDNRTVDFCNEIRNQKIGEYIEDVTGLKIDSYFSATKIHWILNNVKNIKTKALNGELLLGTIDTWLVWNLTGGNLHITDYSNASRTMLFNLHTLSWDKKILDFFEIPETMLPEVRNSSEEYGVIQDKLLGSGTVSIGGLAGDQQAALFGQNCFEIGSVKNTYGTGCFMLMNTGDSIVKSKNGLITTIAWGLNGNITYALEGSIFIAGAVVQWLRDEMRILDKASDTNIIAEQVSDNGGVYFVPAFAGLGAPYWDMNARGLITGINRGTTYKHIVRAALESMAFQTKDVLIAMQTDSNIDITNLNADGGASKNNFLMQFQSDILNVELQRPSITESTALGAASLAAISCGFANIEEISKKRQIDRIFKPQMSEINRNKLYKAWINAIDRAKC